MVESCIVLGMLGIESIEDLRYRRLRLWLVYLYSVAGIVCHFIFQSRTVYDILGGILIGVAMMLISFVTGGKIGIGDGLMLMATGIYLGFADNMELLFGAMFFCGVFAAFLLVFKRKGRKAEIPFIPFLLISYVGMLAI